MLPGRPCNPALQVGADFGTLLQGFFDQLPVRGRQFLHLALQFGEKGAQAEFRCCGVLALAIEASLQGVVDRVGECDDLGVGEVELELLRQQVLFLGVAVEPPAEVVQAFLVVAEAARVDKEVGGVALQAQVVDAGGFDFLAVAVHLFDDVALDAFAEFDFLFEGCLLREALEGCNLFFCVLDAAKE